MWRVADGDGVETGGQVGPQRLGQLLAGRRPQGGVVERLRGREAEVGDVQGRAELVRAGGLRRIGVATSQRGLLVARAEHGRDVEPERREPVFVEAGVEASPDLLERRVGSRRHVRQRPVQIPQDPPAGGVRQPDEVTRADERLHVRAVAHRTHAVAPGGRDVVVVQVSPHVSPDGGDQSRQPLHGLVDLHEPLVQQGAGAHLGGGVHGSGSDTFRSRSGTFIDRFGARIDTCGIGTLLVIRLTRRQTPDQRAPDKHPLGSHGVTGGQGGGHPGSASVILVSVRPPAALYGRHP
jgi:hypothetical protein